MITVTNEANDRIVEQASKRNCNPSLVVDVKPAGCTGMEYKVTWASDEKPEYLIYSKNPVRIYATARANEILEGAELVLKQEGFNTGFDFVNPNVKSQCGCGKSFTT